MSIENDEYFLSDASKNCQIKQFGFDINIIIFKYNIILILLKYELITYNFVLIVDSFDVLYYLRLSLKEASGLRIIVIITFQKK